MGRPKKYKTEAERRAAKRQTDRRAAAKSPKRVKGRFWRLVVPAIEGYGTNPSRPSPSLEDLKARVLDQLQAREKPRGLNHWCVAWQTHQGSGLPHLDILLGYEKVVANPATRYDYLVKHGNLTRYKNLNRAIIEYGRKEDPVPLSNIDTNQFLLESEVKASLYATAERAMMQDPFNFRIESWLDNHDLYRAASKTNIFKSMRVLKIKQQEVCRKKLVNMPGLQPITRKHIRASLNRKQWIEYKSWAGYRIIVDHLNHIAKWGWNRPHKTSNLLLVGRPNTGKTSLCMAIEELCPVYQAGVRSWFPGYVSGIYSMLTWDEFNLSAYPYTTLLKFLQGRPMDLPVKGGHVRKQDNPLVIMTSNLTLERHICKKFRKDCDRETARLNLAPRITEIVIPEGKTLFLLLKLIRANC